MAEAQNGAFRLVEMTRMIKTVKEKMGNKNG
jgi:hypothetical protein